MLVLCANRLRRTHINTIYFRICVTRRVLIIHGIIIIIIPSDFRTEMFVCVCECAWCVDVILHMYAIACIIMLAANENKTDKYIFYIVVFVFLLSSFSSSLDSPQSLFCLAIVVDVVVKCETVFSFFSFFFFCKLCEGVCVSIVRRFTFYGICCKTKQKPTIANKKMKREKKKCGWFGCKL